MLFPGASAYVARMNQLRERGSMHPTCIEGLLVVACISFPDEFVYLVNFARFIPGQSETIGLAHRQSPICNTVFIAFRQA